MKNSPLKCSGKWITQLLHCKHTIPAFNS